MNVLKLIARATALDEANIPVVKLPFKFSVPPRKLNVPVAAKEYAFKVTEPSKILVAILKVVTAPNTAVPPYVNTVPEPLTSSVVGLIVPLVKLKVIPEEIESELQLIVPLIATKLEAMVNAAIVLLFPVIVAAP